jgi:hypothetical protein
MQVISTRTHGIIDYVVGILLIAAPWLFGFANGGIAQWLPVILGLVLLVSSLITDYELSVAKIIPLPVHLGLDIASGALLAVSPWLFGFADVIVWPHLVVGVMEILVACMTPRHAPAARLDAGHTTRA